MVRVLQGLVSVAGRIALSAIFLMSTLGYKIPNFNSAAQLIASKGIPAPRLMLVGAIVFLIVGSLSVIAGYKTRFGAALILVFLVLASYYFHNFWTLSDPKAQQEQMIHFMKNLSDRHGFWGRFVKSLQNTAFRRFSVAFHGLGNGRRLC